MQLTQNIISLSFFFLFGKAVEDSFYSSPNILS